MTACTCIERNDIGPSVPRAYATWLAQDWRKGCPVHRSVPRNLILQGDVREKLREIPDQSVHMVVTSPPYWGLRDYGTEGQLGLEATPEEFVAGMVAVFREVRRVLRDDGTCWLNLGDAYAHGQPGAGSVFDNGRNDGRVSYESDKARGREKVAMLAPGLKPKDLVGIPWMVAFALRADGWWLRSDIIWSKPNPMPESVTDRPTKSHEYLFLLSKRERYYYDAEAIRETAIHEGRVVKASGPNARNALVGDGINDRRVAAGFTEHDTLVSGRNRRTVWEIATQPYPEAHFATFPEELVKPCILAGTSEYGCCSVCGAPWERVVEVDDPEGRLGKGYHDHADDLKRGQRGVFPAEGAPIKRTTGWRPGCDHEAPTWSAIVLDPFLGSGMTAEVALRAGRDFLGIELNPEYVALAEARIQKYRWRLL